MNIKDFWNKAVTFEEYIAHSKDTIRHPQTPQEQEFQGYYRLGIQRMERMLKTFQPSPEQTAALTQKNFKGKILVISEPWCGDASNAIPVTLQLFHQNELRITYRDQEPSLIDDFLTNGSKSIPIIIFLTNDFQVINHWGPRPAYGKVLFEKHKSNPEGYTSEQFHNDLQVYYAKNKGKDTAAELLALV